MRPHRFAISAIALACLVSLVSCNEPLLKVVFFDVGYGDAVLVAPSNADPWLIDGGSESAGAHLVRRLKAHGVSRLGLVFCTHFHPDHAEGLRAVLDALPHAEVIVNEEPAPLGETSRLARSLLSGTIPYRVGHAGDVFQAGDRAAVTILSPAPALEGDLNTRSMVLRVEMDRVSVLLAADADARTEQELLRSCGSRLQATILKISHHGWGTGSTDPFLRAVQPRLGILTVGPSQWAAPAPGTLQRFERRSIPVLRTDRDGEIVALTHGNRIRIRTEKGKRLSLPAHEGSPGQR